MKKLKLKALQLGATEVLTREQLRSVLGGLDGSGSGSGTGSDINCGGCSKWNPATMSTDTASCTKESDIFNGQIFYYCSCPLGGATCG